MSGSNNKKTMPFAGNMPADASRDIPSGQDKDPRNRHLTVYLISLFMICAVMAWRIDHRTGPLREGKGKYLVEDAGISVVFAHYIAKGEGIVYYPDGERVEGYSNPLWTFLIAGLTRAGIDPFDIPRPMGILFSAVGLFFAGLLFWRCTAGPARWLGLLLPPVIGEAGTVVIWAVAGLENGLYAATLLAALAFFAHERKSEKSFPISGFLFFLAALTRPEAMAFGGMAGLYVLATEVAPRRKVTKNHVIFALTFLVPLGLFELWRLWYFAWPLPNSYYGKVSDKNWNDIANLKSKGWKYILDYLRIYNYRAALILCPFALLTIKKWRPSVFLIFPTALTLFFPIYSRGDWMKEWRFNSINTFLILTIALIACVRIAGLAVKPIKKWLPEEKKGLSAGMIAALAAAAIYAVVVSGHFKPSQRHIRKFVKKPIVNTHKLQDRGKYFREMGDKLDLRPGSVLDVDMGGIGAASRMIIYDVGKLCDVPFGINQWHKPFVDQYVFTETKPDFMHAREGFGRGSTILGNPRLRTDYVLLPQDRRLGIKRPNGNYVRKEYLVENDFTPDPKVRVDFEAGAAVAGGRVYPPVAAPGQVVRFRVVWNAPAHIPRDLEMTYVLKSENGAPVQTETRQAVMDWYGASKWKSDEFPVDLVKLKVPENARDGRYHLAVRVTGSAQGAGEIKDTALGVTVGRDSAEAAMQKLIGQAKNHFKTDPRAAGRIVDDLHFYAFGKKQRRLIRKLEKDFAASLADRAAEALEAGDENKAAEFAVKARRLNHRSKKVIAVCRKLSDMAFQRGRTLQKTGGDANLDKAYEEFREAVRRFPQNSRARRQAEETRSTGVLRKGLR